MKKGVLEILVLKLLEKDEKYGYQLINELREQSEELFLLKEGTLYPILYRMEEEGFVTSRWSVPQGKEISRKYYRISEAGSAALKDAVKLWERFSKEVSRILEAGKWEKKC